MKNAFLIEKISHPQKECSYSLVYESLKRGFETYRFALDDFGMYEGKIIAKAHRIYLDKNKIMQEEAALTKIDLAKMDSVHLRHNPPFDSKYTTAMYLLGYLKNKTLVLNDPISIIKYPEKLIPEELQKFCPKTIITRNQDEILEFWKKEKDIIVKPLYEFAGRGVFRLQKNEENYKSIFEALFSKYNEPIIAQKYIPEVKKGDKRILLVDGEFIGSYLRVPPKGQLQAAVDRGGSPKKASLTKREQEICKILKPFLKENGIFVAGLDTIGDYITELNITCPAGFTGVSHFYNIDSQKIYWDKVLEKLK
jgi:glutathione synthase